MVLLKENFGLIILPLYSNANGFTEDGGWGGTGGGLVKNDVILNETYQ